MTKAQRGQTDYRVSRPDMPLLSWKAKPGSRFSLVRFLRHSDFVIHSSFVIRHLVPRGYRYAWTENFRDAALTTSLRLAADDTAIARATPDGELPAVGAGRRITHEARQLFAETLHEPLVHGAHLDPVLDLLDERRRALPAAEHTPCGRRTMITGRSVAPAVAPAVASLSIALDGRRSGRRALSRRWQ